MNIAFCYLSVLSFTCEVSIELYKSNYTQACVVFSYKCFELFVEILIKSFL